MRYRAFKLTSVQRADDGPYQAASAIVCVKCGNTAHVVNTHSKTLPPEMLVKKFTQLGWHVGNAPSDDICPDCRRKKAKVVHMPDTKVVSIAPRTMSREDKRIIFAKLNDIYVDEKVGYSEGWTDQRVADDLNVPRKWVEDIRKENFGDVRDNEEIRRLISETDALQKAIDAARGVISGIEARFAPIKALAGKLRPLVEK